MATLSDATGQFIANCFDDAVAADLEAAAKTGGCGLLTVELDRRAGEETPRVTVKRLQPFAGLATTARMVIECAVDDPAVIRQLRSEEHTSELQSLMRISYAVFCLKKKKHSFQHNYNP